jgi:hypothetical protein
MPTADATRKRIHGRREVVSSRRKRTAHSQAAALTHARSQTAAVARVPAIVAIPHEQAVVTRARRIRRQADGLDGVDRRRGIDPPWVDWEAS